MFLFAVGIAISAIVVLFLLTVFGDYVSRKATSGFVLTVALLNRVVLPLTRLVFITGGAVRWLYLNVVCEFFLWLDHVLHAVFNFVRSILSNIRYYIAEALSFVRRCVDAIYEFASRVIKNVHYYVQLVCTKIINLIDRVLNPIAELIRAIFRELSRIADRILVALVNFGRAIRDFCVKIITNFKYYLDYWFDLDTLWVSIRSSAALYFRVVISIDDFVRGLAASGYIQGIAALGHDKIVSFTGIYQMIPEWFLYFVALPVVGAACVHIFHTDAGIGAFIFTAAAVPIVIHILFGHVFYKFKLEDAGSSFVVMVTTLVQYGAFACGALLLAVGMASFSITALALFSVGAFSVKT
jgi:hypothetical protein